MNTAVARVMAVDDNPTIRKAISMRLSAKGFRVTTAAGGAQALALLDRQEFDLIILDLQMPVVDGDEVLRQVRARYSATELPVIVLAASNDKADINRSLDLGANDYIVKPGDLPILIARIRTQLALKDTVQKLREHSAVMRDVFALVPTGNYRPNASLPAETDAMLERIDTAHRVPFDVLHDNTPMTCFTLSADGRVIYTNDFGARYLGYQPQSLVDRPILDLYAADDREMGQENLNAALETPGRVHRWDIRHIKKSGEVIWMRNTARAVNYGGETLILVTCEDIDDTYKLSELLSFQAQHDDLTGLANRKALEQRLRSVVDSARAECTEHALAVIDLDQFKLINDTCGHAAGDELLCQIARLLKTIVRKRDTVARVGGDEFAILIEDCSAQRADAATENLLKAISTHSFEWENRRYKLTASIGIVMIDAACESSATALSMADTACYAAKDSGRNRKHTFEPDSAPVATRHGEMRWANQINEALDEDRFVLSYQTIAPLAGGSSSGQHYEILLRMRGPDGETILPGEFLPAAERYNLSERIDRWVIGSVFDWLEQRPDEVAAIGLCCINLSGQSIGNNFVLDFILEQFTRRLIDAEKICFEITETAAIADLVQATHFITRLKENGCRFALDDFGSGFSSLAYLKQLPVDYLKIDGAFVRDMATDTIDFAMVRSINDIGHVMGKQTIAEFVETAAILDLLRGIGVDFAQGYHICAPQPLSQLRLSDSKD